MGREGGASQPESENKRKTRAALAKEEEHVLRCLGAAVIMQWNDLPTKIQRDLFDHAISMGEPRYTAQLSGSHASFTDIRMMRTGNKHLAHPNSACPSKREPVSLHEGSFWGTKMASLALGTDVNLRKVG
jgi:hypothetical protein